MEKDAAGPRARLRRIMIPAGLCVLLFIASMLAEVGGAMLLPSDVQLGVLIADAVLAAALAPLAWRGTRGDCGWEPVSDGRISFAGWFVIGMIFLFMYGTVEMTGIWLGSMFPSAGLTEAYTSMSGRDVAVYLVRATTVAPFLEELAARYLLFRGIRREAGFWAGAIVSAVYFALIHGTLMHLPLAIGLTLFLCAMYEATGRFRYCVIFHMLFNWCGGAIVFSFQGVSAGMRFALLAASYASILCLYVFRRQLFGKLFRMDAASAFEAMLERKLDDMAAEPDEAEGGTGEDRPRPGEEDGP